MSGTTFPDFSLCHTTFLTLPGYTSMCSICSAEHAKDPALFSLSVSGNDVVDVCKLKPPTVNDHGDVDNPSFTV